MSKQQENGENDQAIAEGSAYEVIRGRLIEQGLTLEQKTAALNKARADAFGSSEMVVAARTRVRTENNCSGRDIVQVGDLLVFGYNVFIGLKQSTTIEDVFSLYRLVIEGEKHTMEQVPIAGSFLDDKKFRAEFDELYRYYKQTRLVQLTLKEGRLLASFQTGEKIDDRRVFRWTVTPSADRVTYMDNRGERDLEFPPRFDFEWIEAQREDIVHGRFSHLNILDTVFVEAINGDLTVKIENNTDDGEGVYREPVEHQDQSINDAEIAYAKIGALILIKVLPYKEESWRYLVYNTLTQSVTRIDAIGDSCVQLPEDHGIIFPGGYFLDNGDTKSFGIDVPGLQFKRKIRSPNGEDVLYVFYEQITGVVALLSYNLISKTLQNPIVSHGYALSNTGQIIVFTASEEPSRIHPMPIWNTPFTSEEAATVPGEQSFYTRIGNAELVRGISDLFSIGRQIRNDVVSIRHYEALHRSVGKIFDAHFWITDEDTQGIGETAREIVDTVELIVDEFEKVEAIRAQSAQAMQETQKEQRRIVALAESGDWKNIDAFVGVLDSIRKQRGHLATIRELRYIDTDQLDAMNTQMIGVNDLVSQKTAAFLADDAALDSYRDSVKELELELPQKATVAELNPTLESLESISLSIDLLSELSATLKIDDATVRTRIVESISSIYSDLNRVRAKAGKHRERLGSAETVEQFGAQLKLFGQSVANGLGLSATPEKCDEQLTRLLVQLEEMESQFSESERFLKEIFAKRDEVYEAFTAHKQRLLDTRNARAQSLSDAVNRMLDNIERGTRRFNTEDELNTFLASDVMVTKVREVIEQLRDLDSSVKADDAQGRMRMIRDQALRSLRDKSDLYFEDGKVIALGSRHRFSVNTQDMDLTIIPRDGGLAAHLVGTQFFEPIDNVELGELKDYWTMLLESESDAVYRAEYLAASILHAAREERDELSDSILRAALTNFDSALELTRKFAAKRYREGYEKGVHDADAARLLLKLVPVMDAAGLLRFDPAIRGYAAVAWAELSRADNAPGGVGSLLDRAQSAVSLRERLESNDGIGLIERELFELFEHFELQYHGAGLSEQQRRQAAHYLALELGSKAARFTGSLSASKLLTHFSSALDAKTRNEFDKTIVKLAGRPIEQWRLAEAWVRASLTSVKRDELSRYVPEAAARLVTASTLDFVDNKTDVDLKIDGLLGTHARVIDGAMSISLDHFVSRLHHHTHVVAPNYRKYLKLRQSIAKSLRQQLRIDEYKPKPLSSFVRNQLINDAYLPIIGDNLAKQMGTVGETKRSDLQGLLMMISPPGYGKTTLMEYVASRLGLTFMKVNCPALGHRVDSLDPEQAPNATARQELNKLNLALEMGDNVMLYLDDIQHTNPEFLQKFISLCDSTRRIEGVWKGVTKTYDLRGRKFCVVMAGNPYTESGETFKIPDMLANRADIYNLGDILSGKERQFELSYIENCLTSNPLLAPLATRDMADVYKFIDAAKGVEIATTDLSHDYSVAEFTEIVRVLKRLFDVQKIVLKVNQQYIASAAQEDRYRTEPRFLLQGSYRNMSKLAEKLSPAMNERELDALIDDHYRGEAQLLTQGAESNLLKLAELRNALDATDAERWAQIKADFQRNKALGGDDADGQQKIAVQLHDLLLRVDAFSKDMLAKDTRIEVTTESSPDFEKVLDVLNQTIENTLFPLIRSMDDRIAQDKNAHSQLRALTVDVKALQLALEQASSERG